MPGSGPHQYAHYYNALLVLTTIPMQEFNVRVPVSSPLTSTSFDQKAQRLPSRPAPSTLARLLLSVTLPLWSACTAIPMFLSLKNYMAAATVLMGFGFYLGLRLWWRRTPQDDQKSARWYGVSLR